MRNKKTRSQNSHKDLYREIERQEKKKHKDRESLLEQLAGRINLPADMTAGVPILTLIGRYEVRIENYKGILSYTDTTVRIQAKTFYVCIEGKRLEIAYFTEQEMKITGMIAGVSYQTRS